MSQDRKKHLAKLARKKAAYLAKQRQGNTPSMPIIAMTQACAAAARGRRKQVWASGDILAFSTDTGDAWLLERTERWCMRLVIQGQDPIVGGSISETESQLMIEWGAKFRLADGCFYYDPKDIDDEDPPASFNDYPIEAIQAWIDA